MLLLFPGIKSGGIYEVSMKNARKSPFPEFARLRWGITPRLVLTLGETRLGEESYPE